MVRAGGDGRGRVHIGHATGAKRPPGMNRTLPISTLWQPSQWPADAAGRKNLALLVQLRSEEHTSELQSLMRNSYAVFCLKKKTNMKSINIRTSVTTHKS